MTDLFSEPLSCALPVLPEVEGRILQARIERREFSSKTEDVILRPYAARGLSGYSASFEAFGDVLFVRRKTSADVPFERVLLVEDFTDEADLSRKTLDGAGAWIRGGPKKPASLSLEDAGAICEAVRQSWKGSVTLASEVRDANGTVVEAGLRGPQIGALYATLAHWSVTQAPATIVMPTGTGKTETMLAVMASVRPERLMIVVPNANLRDQIAEKFRTLGVLPTAGIVSASAKPPMVAVLDGRPKSVEGVSEIFLRANVIVTTMSVAGQCPVDVQKRMAELCSHLFIDEAHHIAAKTWQSFKGEFSDKAVVQFTATPFRTDGKRVDGKFIYVYPLRKAQEEGYFRPVRFGAVQGLDEDAADAEIVRLVGDRLENDIRAGFDHLAMARGKNIDRAKALHALYVRELPQYAPVLIHSEMGKAERADALARLYARSSRIIVCVDMLGEGFDLPQLKVSGLHDRHKSVAITLQFTGRFTRDAKDIGEATVFANIEQSDIADSLRSLYAEDADWNFLLEVLNENRTSRQLKRADLIAGFSEKLEGVPLQTLIPKMSTIIYRTDCSEWRPYDVDRGVPPFSLYAGPTVNEAERLAVFVTREEIPVRWSNVKDVTDVEWNLYLVYWDKENNRLYINSTRANDLHEKLAKALCGEAVARIFGESVYRVLDGLKRLMLMNLGLSSLLGRKIRYTMFAGSDIAAHLSDAQNSGKRKSNLFGVGFSGDGRRTIGCSAKGKFWALQSAADFSEWVDWCREIGRKVTDPNIPTDGFLRNLVKQKQLAELPNDKVPLAVQWPEEFLMDLEAQLKLRFGSADPVGFYECEIEVVCRDPKVPLEFKVFTEADEAVFAVQIRSDGASYPQISGRPVTFLKGKRERPLSEVFGEDPPHILFADGDFLIFNELFSIPREEERRIFDEKKIEARDWTGINLKAESQGVTKIADSIQRKTIEWLLGDPDYDVIFDDDGTGEIADLVAMRDTGDTLEVDLFHLKYAHGAAPGKRVSDLYEVCGQAQKSIRWMEYPVRILKRMQKREKDRLESKLPSRFERGGLGQIRDWRNRWQFMERKYRIWIVQPGISKAVIEPAQLDLLAATENYLLDTYGAPLRVLASA